MAPPFAPSEGENSSKKGEKGKSQGRTRENTAAASGPVPPTRQYIRVAPPPGDFAKPSRVIWVEVESACYSPKSIHPLPPSTFHLPPRSPRPLPNLPPSPLLPTTTSFSLHTRIRRCRCRINRSIKGIIRSIVVSAPVAAISISSVSKTTGIATATSAFLRIAPDRVLCSAHSPLNPWVSGRSVEENREIVVRQLGSIHRILIFLLSRR